MHHRHDISDKLWKSIEERLPGRTGQTGRPAEDNRRFINAVLWIFRAGAPWRDLPPDYGDWKNTHRRFSRWRDRGIWEKILEVVSGEPDYTWLMIDATFVKAHPHAAGARGGNQAKGIRAKYLIADKGYDSNEIVDLARKRKMIAVIPPRRNRRTKRYLYKELYKKRHKVENAFLRMKQWRGIATRYSKNLSSFVAAVQICCIMLWGKII